MFQFVFRIDGFSSSLCPTCKLRFITVWPLFLSHRGDNESRIIAEGHTSISQEAQQRSSTRAVENQRNIMPPSTHNIQSQRIVRRRNTTANVVMNQAQQNEGNVLSPTSTRNRKQVQRLNYNTITCYVCHKKIQTTDSLGAMARIACSFKCMNEFNNS